MCQKDDLISRQAALDAAIEAVDEWDGGYNVDRANKIIRAMMRLPSEAPDGPNRRKISEAIYMVYKNKSCHMSTEGVVATNYYLAEIWREVFGEEAPIWLKK